MKATERIIIDPEIQHGKPVIRGTRVTVARIIAELAGGMPQKEVMREYELRAEDVDDLIKIARKQANAVGLKRSDIAKAIDKSRG